MRRPWKLAAGMLAATILAAWLGWRAPDIPCPPEASFSVLTYNAGDWMGPVYTTGALQELLARVGLPDVLLLQEVRPGLDVGEFARLLGYSFHAASFPSDPREYGKAVLSRFPIEATEILPLPSPTRVDRDALLATLRVHGRSLLAGNVHLEHIQKPRNAQGEVDASPWRLFRMLAAEALRDTPRNQSVRAILGWLEGRRFDAVVIGGDFNTVIISRPTLAMQQRLDDALWLRRDYLAGTYARIDSLLKPRVDFLFHSQELAVCAAQVVRQTIGDHYPVAATFAFSR